MLKPKNTVTKLKYPLVRFKSSLELEAKRISEREAGGLNY